MKLVRKIIMLMLLTCIFFGINISAEASDMSKELYTTEAVANGTCGENLIWTINNDMLTISGTGDMINYEEYEDTPWHFYASDITTVVIDSGVTGIGGHAFYGFQKLTSITIPDTVINIRGYAFSECDSLMQIVIPDSVTSMGGYVFEGCDALLQVRLSDNITEISGFTFNKCSNLSVVNIPSKCTVIKGRAFAECLKLEEVAFSSVLEIIGENAFMNCVSLYDFTFPTSLKKIEYGAFSGCTSIKEVVIPDNIVYVSSRAFMNCTALVSVTFIGTMPEMYSMIFFGCKSLNAVYTDSLDTWIKAYFEDKFSNPLYYAGKLYVNGTYIGSTLIIPDGVEKIRANVFAGCDATKVVMPDSVKRIDEYCFCNCAELVSVDLSSNLEDIYDGSFSNCINLESVTIPSNIDYIGDFSFENCKKLESIRFPASTRYIADRIFYGCNNLKEVYFDGNAPYIQKVSISQGGSSSLDCGPNQLGAFKGCTFTVYYLQSDTTWTKEVREANYGGEITWIGYESDLTTPYKPYKIANVVNGVHVYWNAVDGASKYGLWRSETGASGFYKWMGNPTTNHFTDTKVESGKTYYYCVSTCNPNTNAHSIMSKPIGITYVGTPDITTRMNLAAGVKLTWDTIEGATGYAIYRKPYIGNKDWIRMTTISGNETFTWTDKSVASANGTLYRYTIRALAGFDMKTLSGCRNTGRTMARLTSRTLNSVTKTAATSVKCTWSTTAQASGYEVRFMNGSTVVKQFTVGNYKTGAKTFTGIPTGANYKVQVRSYKKVDGVGTFYSAWSTPKYVNL